MPKPTKLTPEELEAACAGLKSWSVVNGKLRKMFIFNDFVQAWGFMTRVALIAEKMDHHPEWCNSYGSVKVDLMTHDVAGISALDICLAEHMDALV